MMKKSAVFINDSETTIDEAALLDALKNKASLAQL